ncbi:MAG: GFA family protein, partial [Alphaproteobacteria bacterium]
MTGTSLAGTCHCANIGYRFFPADGGKALSPRKCGCGFCARHGNVYVSDPKGRLEISIRDAAAVNRYTFGHRTAQFLVC